jgi:hypothetical protein
MKTKNEAKSEKLTALQSLKLHVRTSLRAGGLPQGDQLMNTDHKGP